MGKGNRKYNLGLDLGGTKILALVLDAENKVISRSKEKTPVGATVAEIARLMKNTADNALDKCGMKMQEMSHIGAAVPSAVDHTTGRLLHAPNLGWKDTEAQSIFDEIFGRKVVLENDVNSGTYGEFAAGAAKGCSSVVGYFLGTGLGGGIVIGGRLITGKRGMGGELGHTVVKIGGRKCGCGNRGCLEAYCSKAAFSKRFRKLIESKSQKSILTDYCGADLSNVKSSVLAKAYNQKDEVVCSVIDSGARMLGLSIASMSAVLAPDCFVLGGGVMEALGKEMLPNILNGIEENLFGLKMSDIDIRMAALGDDAVATGASLLAASGQF